MKLARAAVAAAAVALPFVPAAHAGVPPLNCGKNVFPTEIAQGYAEAATYSAAFNEALNQYYATQKTIFEDLKTWQAQSCPTAPTACTSRIGLYPNGAEIYSTGLRIDDLHAPPDAGRHLPAIYYVLLTNEYMGALLCTERKVTVDHINKQITKQLGVPPARIDDLPVMTLPKSVTAPLKLDTPLKSGGSNELKKAPPR